MPILNQAAKTLWVIKIDIKIKKIKKINLNLEESSKLGLGSITQASSIVCRDPLSSATAASMMTKRLVESPSFAEYEFEFGWCSFRFCMASSFGFLSVEELEGSESVLRLKVESSISRELWGGVMVLQPEGEDFPAIMQE